MFTSTNLSTAKTDASARFAVDDAINAGRNPVRNGWGALRRWVTDPHVLLIAVCLVHAAAALGYVVAHHMWWEQDETVYLSQVAPHHPALTFTPPRARGMSVLLWPAAHFTLREAVIRTYLVIVGTIGMYVGFRPWLRLRLGRVVPLAALLLSSLWVASFFGAETQPNFVEGVLLLGAAGYFLVALRPGGRRRDLVAVATLLALAALVRPSDATWLFGVLAFATFMIKGPTLRRRLTVGGVMLAGLCIGWSEWVIEAYASYGGFFHRLHEANALNTPGIHFSLLTQAAAVNGPTLCRPCLGVPVSVAHIDWWFAIPPLVALGLLRFRRTRRLAPMTVAAVSGFALVLEYALTVSYAAPRFLLPAYALLSLPCAAGIAALVRWRGRTAAGALIGLLALGGVGAQLVTQTHYLRGIVAKATTSRAEYLTAAQRLRAAGVHAPCVIYGYHGPPVGFALGCSDHPARSVSIRQLAAGRTVIAITTDRDGLRAFPGWEDVKLLPTRTSAHWLAHVLPAGSPIP